MTHPSPSPDPERLAEAFAALAHPSRVELLDLLRTPREIGEIRLRPRRDTADLAADRPAARQTVATHVAKLVEAGFVREERPPDARAYRYVTNGPRVFELLEDLRRASLRQDATGGGLDETRSLDADPPAADARGPRFIVVRGLREGESYPLTARRRTGEAWVIGRRRDVAVPLDYDAYASADNAIVRQAGVAFTIEDVPGSRNGTRVNWRRLPPGEPVRLRDGDVVEVGRSLLVFATG